MSFSRGGLTGVIKRKFDTVSRSTPGNESGRPREASRANDHAAFNIFPFKELLDNRQPRPIAKLSFPASNPSRFGFDGH